MGTILVLLAACSGGKGSPTGETGTETTTNTDTHTGTTDTLPCPYAGAWTAAIPTCDGAEMGAFIYNTGKVTFTSAPPGCVAELELVRQVGSGDTSYPCHVDEALGLTEDGDTWDGTSARSSDDPVGCFGDAAAQGFPIGTVDLEVQPDGLTMTFASSPPWSLSECEGTAALDLTPSSGR